MNGCWSISEQGSDARSSTKGGSRCFIAHDGDLNAAFTITNCREVLGTRPLRIRPSNLRILSMVSHTDLIMYLVAVKSFYKRIGEGEIIIINDGSLTAADCEVLSDHLGSPKLIHITDVNTNGFPIGGCWERILTILDLLNEF